MLKFIKLSYLHHRRSLTRLMQMRSTLYTQSESDNPLASNGVTSYTPDYSIEQQKTVIEFDIEMASVTLIKCDIYEYFLTFSFML